MHCFRWLFDAEAVFLRKNHLVLVVKNTGKNSLFGSDTPLRILLHRQCFCQGFGTLHYIISSFGEQCWWLGGVLFGVGITLSMPCGVLKKSFHIESEWLAIILDQYDTNFDLIDRATKNCFSKNCSKFYRNYSIRLMKWHLKIPF